MPSVLQRFLLNQLGHIKAHAKEWHAAEFIILQLDEYGYLTLGFKELAEKAGCDLETTAEAIRIVQSLNPAGVGARDLRECLLLQLTRLKKTDSLEYRILHDHMKDLSQKQTLRLLMDIANALGVEHREVMQAVGRIKNLHPRPGRGFSSPELN